LIATMRLAPVIAAVALQLAAAAALHAQSDEAVLRAFETGYERAIEKASKVVVSIKVDRKADTAKRPARGGIGMLGAGAFANRPEAPVTGFILEADGWIATSCFNVIGDLRGVDVTMPDGLILHAKVMGWNVGSDIALLKVEATGLPTLAAANPADLRTGDLVVAVGRDPDGRGVTANPGILSAPGRHMGRSVQVDARLNYGNTGGPLVNLDGRLVGLCNKVNIVSAGDRGQNSGVGFVMLSSKIAEMLPSLKKGDRNQGGGGRPFLGVMGDVEYTGGDGARLRTILAGGSAEKAGLQSGDVIQQLNGDKIANFDDLRGAILKHKIGETVKLKVKRGDEVLDFEMPLGENPSE
jgi:serine protease Do